MGRRKVDAYWEAHSWTARPDLVAVYDGMMPERFKGEIHENEIGEIAWITSGRSTMAVFPGEADLRENFELILRNWDR